MNKFNRLLIIIIIILVFINGFFIYSFINDSKGKEVVVNNIEVSGITTDLTKVIDNNKSSIVTVVNDSNTGSGFIYSKNNNSIYVLTAYHVLNENDNYVILPSSAKLPATIKGYDILLDLAVLEIISDLEIKPVVLGNSTIIKDGEFVVSIGTPTSIEYAGSNEFGVISNKNLSLLNTIKFNKQDISYYGNYIQLSSNLTSGYSGAPVFNMNSEIIGMCLMEDNKQVLCSPINEIKIVANKIINDEEYSKLNLGIKGNYIANMENYEKASLNIPLDVVNGLFVKDVLQNTLGHIMGIRTNDIIKTINNKTIETIDSLLEIEYSNNQEITVTVIRNNEEIVLSSVVHD